jgi:hypothetical protein
MIAVIPCYEMYDPKQLTKEHIDPRNHTLVSGLSNEFNEILADAQYNYSKSDYFLPYRVKEYPAPCNPGDPVEVLVQGEWQVLPFQGEWYRHEALKFSRRRLGLRNYRVNSSELWENRLKDYEERTGATVIVCSWDGGLSKNQTVKRRCEHGLSKELSLWAVVKNVNCCGIEHNREWAVIASKIRGDQLRKKHD